MARLSALFSLALAIPAARAEDLLFSTPLAPPGLAHGPLRVVRLKPGSPPEVIAERTSNATFSYRFDFPTVSGNGTVLSYSEEATCIAGRQGCPGIGRIVTFRGTTVLRAGRPRASAPGFAVLSRNGRYAFSFATSFFGSSDSPGVRDLDEQRSGPPVEPERLGGGCRIVSNTGVAIFPGERDLVAASLTGVRRLPLPQPAIATMISDDGAAAIISTTSGLHRLSLDSGAQTLLRTTPEPVTTLCATGDLRRIVFLENRRAVLLENGRLRVLWSEPVESATLSDDGRTATYSAFGRIWQHEIDGTAPPKLVAVMEGPPRALDPPVPGSLLRIEASGIAPGSKAWLGAAALPVLNAQPGLLIAQVPWETPPAAAEVRIENPNGDATVFTAPPLSVTVRDLTPRFIRTREDDALAFHPAFDHAVTQTNPARPGQFINLYMTGLGPVTRPVETGKPSPADPPAEIRSQLMCSFTGSFASGRPALWAGLAPGLTGVYQVAVEIPHDFDRPAARSSLTCGLGPGVFDSAPVFAGN